MCFACVFGGQTYLVRQSFFFKMTSKPNEKMVKAEMNDVHQMFARKAEELNQKTVVDKKLIRSRNRLSGFLLAAMVGGVYAYTILTVKQEKFLDDLDDPAQPSSK